MNVVYRLSSKIKLLITIITDILFMLLIPVWVILLINNYNVGVLILIVIIYLFATFISFCNYRKKIIVGNGYITFIELRKVVIPITEIISITNNRCIEVKTISKTYSFSGYTIITSINVLKNEELVNNINKTIKL